MKSKEKHAKWDKETADTWQIKGDCLVNPDIVVSVIIFFAALLFLQSMCYIYGEPVAGKLILKLIFFTETTGWLPK